MGSLVVAIIIGIVGIAAFLFIPTGKDGLPGAVKNGIAAVLVIVSAAIAGAGAVGMNESGYCTHVRTIFGTETRKCEAGWYSKMWGTTTQWPHYITVAFTDDEVVDAAAAYPRHTVRLSDNWTGHVKATARFAIPQDEKQFMELHQTYLSPESLTTKALRPAMVSSLDSVANMFSMEGYFANGEREQFKSEFRNGLKQGRAQVKQIRVDNFGVNLADVAPNEMEEAADKSRVNNSNSRRTKMVKRLDESGNAIRVQHDYTQYGVTVATAVLEDIDPDDKFEEQIQARKDAASRRIVAREQRLEQEEQRLLAIQKGETDIATRQAEARVEQIEKTTKEETEKKLALIRADRRRDEAKIAKETSEISLEKARIDAQATQVTADADAYAKKAAIEADGALKQKLDAWIKAQEYWANAASQINVPHTVFGGSNGDQGSALGTVDQFMALMTTQAAKQLSLDTTIKNQ